MITITKQQLEQIIEHSRAEASSEACGLLAGTEAEVRKVFKMTNDERSNTRYLVNPKEQFRVFKEMRSAGLELLGIYHSHPESEAYPSQTDCQLAVYDVVYFIVSLERGEPLVKAYKIKDGAINEEEFLISD